MKKLLALVAMLGLVGCAGMDVDNGQRGWRVMSDNVDMFVTENGGHMAPVRFCTDTNSPRSSRTTSARGRTKG